MGSCSIALGKFLRASRWKPSGVAAAGCDRVVVLLLVSSVSKA